MENIVAIALVVLALIVLVTYARFFVIVALAICLLYLFAASPSDKKVAPKSAAPQAGEWKGKIEQ